MDFNELRNESEKKHTLLRVNLIGGFLGVCLLVFAGLLFYTQKINGAEYLSQSVRTITRSEKVEASRGIITDRNGKVLVSNRQTYTLTFDASLLSAKDDQNSCILRLLQLCQQQGVTWDDNLPISSAAPFTYELDGISDTMGKRFLLFLQETKQDGEALVPKSWELEDLTVENLEARGLTAGKLVELLRDEDHYALDASLTDNEARMVIGVRYELELRKKEITNTSYIIAEDITTEMISMLSDGDYAGAKVSTSNVREYNTDYAAHILGYVLRLDAEDYKELKDQGYDMDDWVGKAGVEQAFESYLKGTDGVRTIFTNADGKVTSEIYSTDPQPGNTVALTIDINFQQSVEEALAATVSSMNREDGHYTRGAAAAAVEIGTGDILALASYPTYNLETFRQEISELSTDESKPMWNRATSGTYPPGSTLKPATAIAALQEGKVGLRETLYCDGHWEYPNSIYGTYCWRHSGCGLLTITSAIRESCTFFFADMGYRLGMDKLREYFSAFGLGQSTGIEISESTGRLPENPEGEDQAPWAGYGQSNQLYTPLQLANYIATLVDGGTRYPAHLLKSVKTYDNSQVIYSEEEQEPLSTLDIDQDNLDAVLEGMRELAAEGSVSSYFKNCVVTAGAKTGTAQLGSGITNNGVFVCFAPYEDPQIALAVVIEQGGSGAALASTAVEILNAYFTKEEIGTVILGEGQLLE